jgi:tRNA synthetases class II (D, K and N)
MLKTIVRNIQGATLRNKDDPNRLPRSIMPPIALRARFFKGPYPQLDFIPALNKVLGLKLPNLDAESAARELISIFQVKEVALPAHPTLPRLLDKLSATYLEPQCDEPTWIINYPECLSPLSKSFPHPSPDVAQPVAARAELFVRGREIVNCYEEENSPFEQRRKFMMQQEYADTSAGRTRDSETMEVDEAYLKALEWGLPPTGGWGCGIDRLVMLLTEKQRINDVLTFGNLRSVTRTPESREMVSRPMWPTTLSNGEGVSGGRNERRADDVQAEESPSPQIDAAEEAIIKIKENLKKGKSGRSKLRKKRRQTLSAEQERLSKWLSEAVGPDGAKGRDGAGGLDAEELPPKE